MDMSELCGVPLTVASQGGKIARYKLVGIIECLRLLCEAEAKDGDLSKFSVQELEAWCGCDDGDDATFGVDHMLATLESCGYLSHVPVEGQDERRYVALELLWKPKEEKPKTPKRKKRQGTDVQADLFNPPIPDGLGGDFRSQWGRWIEYRRTKGRPVTVSIATKQLAYLTHLGPEAARDAIDDAIMHGRYGLNSSVTEGATSGG